MTVMRVSAEEVAALGGALSGISEALQAHAAVVDVHGWALGPGRTPSSLETLLTNWRRRRLEMCAYLDDLSAAAALAGGGYVVLEQEVAGHFGGGTAP